MWRKGNFPPAHRSKGRQLGNGRTGIQECRVSAARCHPQHAKPQANTGLQAEKRDFAGYISTKDLQVKKCQGEVYLALLLPDGITTQTHAHTYMYLPTLLGSIDCSLPVMKIIISATTSASEDVVKYATVHASSTCSHQRTLWP